MHETDNASGRPLSNADWLEAHHLAKRRERRAYCERLAKIRPASIVDIGCATGLWLSELDAVLPEETELIGIDGDEDALAEARRRARGWSRPHRFLQLDVDAQPEAIPEVDLTLLFNVAPYLSRLEDVLALVAARGGAIAIRQYDGAMLRFGPLSGTDRTLIEASTAASVGASDEFRHFDLDRVFDALQRSAFSHRQIEFETFARSSPFTSSFQAYLEGHLDWLARGLSDAARERLQRWRRRPPDAPRYFVGVDMVALLS